MWQWAIIDVQFGFVIEEGFLTKEDAEKTRNELENDADSKLFNLKYKVELMPM